MHLCIYTRLLCLCLDFRGMKRNPNAITELHTECSTLTVTYFRDFCSNDDINSGLSGHISSLTFPPWMSWTLVLFCCKMALGAKQGSGCGLLSPRRSESKQVNHVQLNKHALSKRKFPVQSASFHLTAGVHLECHCICCGHLHDDRTQDSI